MELHLVHQHKDGRLAVVGVFMKEGKPHDELQKIWKRLPKKTAELNDKRSLLNASRLLPKERGRYQYNGSLTTPPCSEGVLWLVLSEPIEVSDDQIAKFKSLFTHNARPIQAGNERFLLKTD